MEIFEAAQKKKKQQSEAELRKMIELEGLEPKKHNSLPNCKCPYSTVEEER